MAVQAMILGGCQQICEMCLCHSVVHPIRDVKIVFLYSILGIKNSIFLIIVYQPTRGNWFRQASSTDNESACALVVPSAPRHRDSLAASAAAVEHSSNSHCLTHTSFGAPNSCPGIVDQRLF